MKVCYLCSQPVDGSRSSRDHVIPRALRGKGPPKVKGFDYGGVLPTHSTCNNGFGDETYVSKALQLLGALCDPKTTFCQSAPGNLKGRVLMLNEARLPGFGLQDFRFFGIHDARSDSMASMDDSDYFTRKPRVYFKKTVRNIILSVLAKSAAALLIKRHLEDLPSNWHIVCVFFVGDATKIDLLAFFRKTKPFAKDIRVGMSRFEASSWVSCYVTGTTKVLYFFSWMMTVT